MVSTAKIAGATEFNQMMLVDYFAWIVVIFTLGAVAVMFIKINSLMSKAVAF
jgi:hypothetical protein